MSSDGAHLAVHGELDVSTSPQLAAVLDATVAQEPAQIILDLARLEFVDGAGLWAIARAAEGPGGDGPRVRVRNVSPITRRLFSIVGLDHLLDVDGDDEIRVEHAGARAPGHAVSEMPAEEEPVSTGRGLVDEAMAGVVTLLGAVILDAKAISVTLRRKERLVTAAADGALGRELDEVQYDGGEGPCVQASVEGVQIVAQLPRDGDRWPRFAATSGAHGVHGIVSTPILVGGEPVGAVNVYLERPVPHEEDRLLPQLFAAHAATVLTGLAGHAGD